MIDHQVPIIDLSPYFSGSDEGKATVAKAVGEACRSIGFLVISGHGVDPALITQVREVSRAYFDLPTAEKMKLKMPADKYRGCHQHVIVHARFNKRDHGRDHHTDAGPDYAATRSPRMAHLFEAVDEEYRSQEIAGAYQPMGYIRG